MVSRGGGRGGRRRGPSASETKKKVKPKSTIKPLKFKKINNNKKIFNLGVIENRTKNEGITEINKVIRNDVKGRE